MDISTPSQMLNEALPNTSTYHPSNDSKVTPTCLRKLLQPYSYTQKDSTLFEKISHLVKDIFMVIGFIALFTVTIAALGIPGFIMVQLSKKLDQLKAGLDKINQENTERPIYIVYKRENKSDATNFIKVKSHQKYIPKHEEIEGTHYIEVIVPFYVQNQNDDTAIYRWLIAEERKPETDRWKPVMPTQSELRIERIWKFFNT